MSNNNYASERSLNSKSRFSYEHEDDVFDLPYEEDVPEMSDIELTLSKRGVITPLAIFD